MVDRTLFSADFDAGEEGFVYRDDAFRGTSAPLYADGARAVAAGFGGGGALRVALGGVDDSDVTGMLGGWERSFTLTEPQQVMLTFRFKLTQASNYEADEFSQVLASLDGTLIGTGGSDFIAQISGNGNGGPVRTTGWQEVELDLGVLGGGEHTVILGGFNNQKTLADESTEILFDDVALVGQALPPLPDDGVLIDADFDADANGFSYLDDAFRGTDQPDFADGQRIAAGGFSGGALRVELGGQNDSDINGMSAGWRTSFTLGEEAEVTLTFRYNLTQAPNYENDEFSQVLASLDGTLIGTGGNDFIARITGNGNGGPARSTGWQTGELNLGLLGPGVHELVIGGFNNKKTLADESTELLIDDVLVTTPADRQPLFTDQADVVDFNTVLASDYQDGTQYDALGGDDSVILPDVANAVAAGFVIGTNFFAGAGDDSVTGGDGDDIITGGPSGSRINANATDNDWLFGGAGNDTLIGRFGMDTLVGGDGNDTLQGGLESSTLLGGSGDDLLIGAGAGDSPM